MILRHPSTIVLLGDLNSSVRSYMQEIWPAVVGSYGAGEHNERGVKLLQFCAINNLFIANTIFKHKEMRRYTWTSPKRREMKIDCIIMSKKLKSTLKKCKTYISAEIGSDHLLVIANLVMKKSKKNETYSKKTTVMTRINCKACTPNKNDVTKPV